MNQDLAFEITPAKARKLLKASEICKMVLPNGIEDISKTDLLDIQGSFAEKELMQFIVDTDYRCVVCSPPGLTRTRFIELIKQTCTNNIIVTGYNKQLWLKEVHFEPITSAVNHKFQDGKRSSILIYDYGVMPNEDNIEIISNEFPKTIVFVCYEAMRNAGQKSFKKALRDVNSVLFLQQQIESYGVNLSGDPAKFEWWNPACSLYPNMPRDIFFLSEFSFKWNMTRGTNWLRQEINDIAFLYNAFLPEKMINYGWFRDK